MTVHALGRINTVTAGSRIPILPRTACNRLRFDMPSIVTGNVLIKSNINGNVIRELRPAGAGLPNDFFEVETEAGMADIYTDQYAVDSVTSGDGCYVTWWEE